MARCTDTDAKTMAVVLERAYRHKGTAIIELLQNCPVFNDGIWDAVKDDPKNLQIKLEDGKPLTFAGGAKGIRINADMVPEIVDVGDGPLQVPEHQLLVHRERGSKAYASLVSGMLHPAFPMPVGVLHVEEKASYEAMAQQQVADAVTKQGRGDLEKLLYSGMTWEVGADGVKA
jgi:2-oxoglutarate ferredoxin oxidoreductase subunit beta